jgi:hypothetical protein
MLTDNKNDLGNQTSIPLSHEWKLPHCETAKQTTRYYEAHAHWQQEWFRESNLNSVISWCLIVKLQNKPQDMRHDQLAADGGLPHIVAGVKTHATCYPRMYNVWLLKFRKCYHKIESKSDMSLLLLTGPFWCASAAFQIITMCID